MKDTLQSIVYIHGLEGSSRGVKTRLLRRLYPGVLAPDFRGSFLERIAQLESIIKDKTGWIMIGSSLGGLMAANYVYHHPDQVKKLILLAPAILLPEFCASSRNPIRVPTTIIHGTLDELLPFDSVKALAFQVFTNLNFISVNDTHSLYLTVHQLDWITLITSTNPNHSRKGSG